ncbi:hypothetical protein D3C85_862260 [compost metagenome]
MLAGLNKGPGHTQVAWNSALIYDMIFTQHAAMWNLSYKQPKRPSTLAIVEAMGVDDLACGADSHLSVWDDLSISKVQYIVDSRC